MLFPDEEAIIGIGGIGLRTLGFFYVVQALNNCITGIVRGAGASGVPMLCAFLNMGVRILLSFLLAYRAGNYRGLYEAMIIGNGCNAAALLLYYKFGNWRNASVVAAEGRMPEEDS